MVLLYIIDITICVLDYSNHEIKHHSEHHHDLEEMDHIDEEDVHVFPEAVRLNDHQGAIHWET